MQVFVNGRPVTIQLLGAASAVTWKNWAVNQYRKLAAVYAQNFHKQYQFSDATVVMYQERSAGFIQIWGEAESISIVPHFLWRGTQVSPDSLLGLGLSDSIYNLADEMFGDTLQPTAYFRDGITEVYESTVVPPSYVQGEAADRIDGIELPKLIYHLRSPCRYTGKMRWLIQELWAAGVRFGDNEDERPVIPFSFTSRLTHGLASYPTKDGDTGYWLIEVGRHGTYAVNLGTLSGDNLTLLRQEIEQACEPYWSEIDPIVALSDEGVLGGCVRLWSAFLTLPNDDPQKPIELLTQAQMQATTDKGDPWSIHYGWAFSASGAECQNVFGANGITNDRAKTKYGEVIAPLSANFPDLLFAYEMERWKIAFDVTATNIGADLRILEGFDDPKNLFPGGRRGGSQFFYPRPLTGGILLQNTAGKASTYRQAVNATSAATCHETDAPIFVFYSGEVEQVVRWKQHFISYNIGGTYDTTAPLSPSIAPWGWTDGGGCHGADIWIYNSSTIRYEQGYFGVGQKDVSMSWSGSAEHRNALESSLGQHFSTQSSAFVPAYGRFVTYRFFPTYYSADATRELYTNYADTYVDALVMPIYDRESVYFIESSVQGGPVLYDFYTNWGGGVSVSSIPADPVRVDVHEYTDGIGYGPKLGSFTDVPGSSVSGTFPGSNPYSTHDTDSSPIQTRNYSGELLVGREDYLLEILTDKPPPVTSYDGLDGDDYETDIWTTNEFAKAIVFKDDSIEERFITEPFWAMASWHNENEHQVSYISGRPDNESVIVNSPEFGMTPDTFPTAVVRNVNLPASQLDLPESEWEY